MCKRLFYVLLLLLPALSPFTAEAAFDVSMWNLSARLSQETDDLPISDREDILTVSNPLNHVSLVQVNQSYTNVEYDYSWLRELTTGTFNTSIIHAVRAPRVFASSVGDIFVVPTEDIRVSVDASLTYSHTPGDESGIGLAYSIRNITLGQFVSQVSHIGGNLYLEPSAGTFTISRDDILTAGSTYRIHYGVGADNNADFLHPPTGIIDAAGWVNFSIAPVPEPTTLALLITVSPFLLCPRRRRCVE